MKVELKIELDTGNALITIVGNVETVDKILTRILDSDIGQFAI